MEKWILLFTTDKLPYALHNLNILSLPQGLSYRFRYRNNYISEPLINNLDDLKDDLKEEKKTLDGLVIFQFDDGSYFPFRKIKLINLYDYGNLFFFITSLEELINVNEKSIPELTSNIEKLINNKYTPPDKLVYLVDKPELNLNYVNERQVAERENLNKIWSNSVDILSRADNLKNLAFLRFEILKGIKERRKIFPSYLTGELRGFRLTPGKDYLVEFFEYTNIPSYDKSETIDMFSVSLQDDPNRIEVIKPEEIVDGKYDKFDLIFSTIPDASKDTAFLRIKNTQKKKDDRIPDIYIPFCVRLPKVWSYLRPLLLLISVVAFIDPNFMIWLIKSILSLCPPFQKFISNISVHFTNKEKWIQLGAFLLFISVFWNFKLQSMFKDINKKLFK
jgi:hypothetical protein